MQNSFLHAVCALSFFPSVGVGGQAFTPHSSPRSRAGLLRVRLVRRGVRPVTSPVPPCPSIRPALCAAARNPDLEALAVIPRGQSDPVLTVTISMEARADLESVVEWEFLPLVPSPHRELRLLPFQKRHSPGSDEHG